ncbi:MAG: AI-2E family transporter [Oscillospiraceae bacterium]
MNNFKWDKKYLYWGITAFCVIIACITFFWIIQRWDGIKTAASALYRILSPIIWGFALAYILTPFVKMFQKKLFDPLGKKVFATNEKKAHGLARGLAIFASLLLMFAIISALVSLVIPQVYQSVESIVLNFSSNLAKLEIWANKWLEGFPEIEKNFSELVGDIGASFTQWAKTTLLPQMNDIVTSVSVGVISVFKVIANLFISVAVSAYVMFSREQFTAQGKKLMYCIIPVKQVKRILTAIRFTDRSFMGFFSGKLLDALIIGIICYIGCLLIGIPDAVLIAVIIGITDIIPFFGPFIGAIPSALIVLMYSPWKCLIFIAFIIVLQQFDGNILGPKILGSSTGLNGFWVLFSILLFAGLFGPIGMIIGVPVFAVLYAGVKSLVSGRLKKRGLPSETEVYKNMDHIDPKTLNPIERPPESELKRRREAAQKVKKEQKAAENNPTAKTETKVGEEKKNDNKK